MNNFFLLIRNSNKSNNAIINDDFITLIKYLKMRISIPIYMSVCMSVSRMKPIMIKLSAWATDYIIMCNYYPEYDIIAFITNIL